MTLQEFERQVREAFLYGIDYSDKVKYKFFMSNGEDSEPNGEMVVALGSSEYKLPLIIGEDGEVGINTDEYFTIELTQESVFAYCLFEEQRRHEKLRKKK